MICLNTHFDHKNHCFKADFDAFFPDNSLKFKHFVWSERKIKIDMPCHKEFVMAKLRIIFDTIVYRPYTTNW